MKNQYLLYFLCFFLFSCEKDASLTSQVTTRIKNLVLTTARLGFNSTDSFVYQYDSLNRVISEKAFPSNDSISYTYDALNSYVQKLYKNGVEKSNIIYLLNSMGKIDSTLIISSNKMDTATVKWIYQNTNSINKVYHYDVKKVLWKIETYTYDGNNNVLNIEENLVKDNILNTRTFEVNSVKPYWYSTHPYGMPILFTNTPTKQITNGNIISNITYEFDQLNRITKEIWETTANNSLTTKEYTYY